jgi:uncharacterized protein YhjY with autotransporter beta-barrel domain
MPYGTVNADVIQTSTSGGVLGAKNASTLQNRLINSGFTLNQRGYVSGTSLSSGSYDGLTWLDSSPKPTKDELDALWESTQATIAAKEQSAKDAKASALAKLTTLGLTENEVKALLGTAL